MSKFNFIAPICPTGYGYVAVNILRHLSQSHDVALFPIGAYMPPDELRSSFDRLRINALSYDPAAPSVRVFHQDQLAEHVGRGPRVGFPFFEMDSLRYGEVHHLNQMDLVCVASEWARGVAANSGVSRDKLRVVPLGVDREVFHEGVVGDRLSDQTVFFTVGKYEVRKGHDFLIRCFNRAFSPADKVVLRMMCDNPILGPRNEAWRRESLTSKMGAHGRIDLVPRSPSQAGVARLMASGDVGVFPARAEGWNLEIPEAMSLGKHVIATNYSAHTEYVTPENCRLIESSGTEAAFDGVFFHGEGDWMKLGDAQEEQLVAHMRELHRLKQLGRLGVNAAGIETAKRLPWKISAEKLAAAVNA